jgi:hypothetical protein
MKKKRIMYNFVGGKGADIRQPSASACRRMLREEKLLVKINSIALYRV